MLITLDLTFSFAPVKFNLFRFARGANSFGSFEFSRVHSEWIHSDSLGFVRPSGSFGRVRIRFGSFGFASTYRKRMGETKRRGSSNNSFRRRRHALIPRAGQNDCSQTSGPTPVDVPSDYRPRSRLDFLSEKARSCVSKFYQCGSDPHQFGTSNLRFFFFFLNHTA